MDRCVIYRRLLNICVELSRLLADINEAENPQLSAGCRTVLQIMQQYRQAAAERCVFGENGRSTEAMICDYVEERQNAIANGTYGEDEIDTTSDYSGQESEENDMDDRCDCCS